MKKILFVFGTRPEAIKMAPLVKACEANNNFKSKVCVTAQHREMLDQALYLFDIVPDYDLDLMTPGQSLNDVTSAILLKLKPILKEYQPDILLVHGDTATTFAASLAAYYEQIDVGHIEAGLRTGNIYSPWPEEINRKLTSSIARFHFAPTENAKKNLISEGISEDQICVTGNTVVDALMTVQYKIKTDSETAMQLGTQFNKIDFFKKIILVTGHRRENFGNGFEAICEALTSLAVKRPEVEILFPVHLNPNVQNPAKKYLSGYNNIHLIEPVDYLPFVYLMMKSYIILTDSGGIQEEAPSLGKPVLVMRDTTERPEAVNAGTVKLVGTNTVHIIREVNGLLDDETKYLQMSTLDNPYGDGRASFAILKFLEQKYAV